MFWVFLYAEITLQLYLWLRYCYSYITVTSQLRRYLLLHNFVTILLLIRSSYITFTLKLKLIFILRFSLYSGYVTVIYMVTLLLFIHYGNVTVTSYYVTSVLFTVTLFCSYLIIATLQLRYVYVEIKINHCCEVFCML